MKPLDAYYRDLAPGATGRPNRANPFLTPGKLRQVDVFGDPLDDDVYVPAPCISIPVTDEMRERDMRERAARAAKIGLAWSLPPPLPEQAYGRPVKKTQRAAPKPKRTLTRKPKDASLKTPNFPNRPAPLNSAPAPVPLEAERDRIAPLTRPGTHRIVSREGLMIGQRFGRIGQMLIQIAKVPEGFAFEVLCETPKKALNTLTQLKARGKAAGEKYVVRGGTHGCLCYAWFETKPEAKG